MESTKFNDNLEVEDPCKCIESKEEKIQNETFLIWRNTEEDGHQPFKNISENTDLKKKA